MPTVTVNPPKTPVTKGSNGIAAATLPNVCKMPGPPAPFVPTPLPNIGKSGDLPKGYSKTVKIEGSPVAIRGASFGSMGDEASKGSGGGIVSNNAQGPTTFLGLGSLNVKIEGKNVHLLGDPMLNNNGPSGSPPNSATMAGVEQASGAAGSTWDVDCILKTFCAGDSEDKAVVTKLPRLTVNKREEKQVHYKKFHGGKWVDDGFTSAGSANGTTVWINSQTSCSDAASTLFHEVTHTDQPSSMPGSQCEYDAYIKEEKWRIKRGLPPGGPNFRKTIKDPKNPKKKIVVPNESAIKADVDATYAYNPPTPIGGGPPPPAVLGLTPDGKKVRLSDGTTRPPKEGDAYRLPDTGGKTLETIDAKKWKCP